MNKRNIKKAPVKNRSTEKSKKKPEKNRNDKKSLVPLLIILIVLLGLTLFVTFSDKSNFLSELFSKNTEEVPLIERPEIVQSDIEKPDNNEENSFTVSKEVEIKTETSIDKEITENDVPQKSMKSRLFYVKVSDEGQISLKSVIRTVDYTSKPLTETIKSLISGPDRSDLNKELLNLIPKDSQIISIKISSGIAYLDFNESFRYNSLGFEGYKAQLMQITYTATEFQSVDYVQILINGEIYDYLGAEGVYIGKPIDREYFNSF